MGIVQYSPRAYTIGADITITATAAVQAGHLVAVDAGSTAAAMIGKHAATGGHILGVAANNGDAGDQVTVALTGIVRVVAGSAITAGAPVSVGTDGKVVPTASEATVIGLAVTSAASGALAHILIK